MFTVRTTSLPAPRGMILVFLVTAIIFVMNADAARAASLAERLSGRFLIQVERYGESWWVHPKTRMRYYLGRPQDAFNLMRAQGIGISNKDLEKIPLIGSTTPVDWKLVKRLQGTIVLQVESRGEAWYVSPVDGRRFYLGRPADALAHMRNLGLGIKDNDLEKIEEHPTSKVLRGNVYVNDELGFEVKYPREWAIQGPYPLTMNTAQGTEIKFSPPGPSHVSGVVVEVFDVASQESFEQAFTRIYRTETSGSGIKKSKMKVGGTMADYYGNMPGFVSYDEVFLVHGNRLYGIRFFKRDDTVNAILSSFTLRKANMSQPAAVKEFNVTAANYSFSPAVMRVKKGDRVKVNLTSTEGTHDWVLYEFGTTVLPAVSAGQSASVEFTADRTGSFEYYCSIGNHRAMGMKGTLIVEE